MLHEIYKCYIKYIYINTKALFLYICVILNYVILYTIYIYVHPPPEPTKTAFSFAFTMKTGVFPSSISPMVLYRWNIC